MGGWVVGAQTGSTWVCQGSEWREQGLVEESTPHQLRLALEVCSPSGGASGSEVTMWGWDLNLEGPLGRGCVALGVLSPTAQSSG